MSKRYFLYDVLNDYSVAKVDGKSDYGTLAHAKTRAVKDNSDRRVLWAKKDMPGMDKSFDNWFGRNTDNELINIISTHGMISSNPKKRTKKKAPVQECQWFAMCENAAVTTEPHPILGPVPICKRCKDKVARLSNPRKKNPKDTARVFYAANAVYSVEFNGNGWYVFRNDNYGTHVEHFAGPGDKGKQDAIDYLKALKKMTAKAPATNPRKKNPEIEIRELILWAENTEKLSNQFYSIIKNLERKAKKGIYDPVLAAKLWKYWIDEAVKDYNKEILGGGYSLRQNVFTVQDRKDAAIEVERQWRDDVKRGDNPLRKKNPTTYYNVFKCKGNDVRWLKGFAIDKPRWTLTRGDAAKYRYEHEARGIAKYAYARGWKVGAAEKGSRVADIIKICKPGKA